MASIYRDPASGVWHIHFRYGGRQFHKSLKTADGKDAEALKGRVEGTLAAVERGWVSVPPNADLWAFLYSGGKLEAKPTAAEVLTLENLFARYEGQLPPGTMEDNSLATCRLHQAHLLRVLGARQPAPALTTADLQRYVNARAREHYRGEPIKARTIRKEVASFRAVWNWAASHGLVAGPAPTRALKYAKGDEKLPFMTWDEVEQRVGRGGLTPKEVKRLWDCLFLDTRQIGELLGYVRDRSAHRFVYPMFVFVGHTSARRSEMMRSRVEDLDFRAQEVVLREKKKDRSVKVTFRRVPMTPLFSEVMRAWLREGHPGGPYTFCLGTTRMRRRAEPEPLTKDQANHYFTEALAGGKWGVVRGFHLFRHSFASNCAAAGIDQRVIDEWMGHQTEEMRKRYRHLVPDQQKLAIQTVFGPVLANAVQACSSST